MSRLLRQPEVLDRVGLSRTTVWKLEREGLFPQRRRITGNLVGWLDTEIEEFVTSREIVDVHEGDDS